MPRPLRVHLIGTGHVFEISDAIRAVLLAERPTCVALELDARRFQGLRERQLGRVPSKADRKKAPFAYRVLAKYQEDVADAFGVQPGQEMVAAAEAAQQLGAHVALVDRDAQDMIQEAMRSMTWRERLRFLWSSLRGALSKDQGDSVQAELERYNQDPQAYLDEVGKQFPTIRRVLIDERNEHMAKEIRRLASQFERVAAVVGDGHVPGMLAALSDLEPSVTRLRDLQARKGISGVAWRRSPQGDSVGFSFDGQSLEGSFERP